MNEISAINTAFSIASFLFLLGFIIAIFPLLKRGGFREALYNAAIVNNIGVVQSGGDKIKIDLLTGDTKEKRIGVSLSMGAVIFYTEIFTTLNKENARKLIACLQSTVDEM